MVIVMLLNEQPHLNILTTGRYHQKEDILFLLIVGDDALSLHHRLINGCVPIYVYRIEYLDEVLKRHHDLVSSMPLIDHEVGNAEMGAACAECYQGWR